MNLIKSSWAIALGCLLVGQAGLAIAQEYKPRRRGLPDQRDGAGSRSPTCLLGPKKFAALVPKDAISTSTTPASSLFWYVPKTTATSAELRIVEQVNPRLETEIFVTQIPLQAGGGVMAYGLPPEVTKALSPNKVYRWQFSIGCSPRNPSQNPFLEGTLELDEVPASLTTTLAQATTPRDRAIAYAAAGFWQDAIATLATPRCLNPRDANIQTAWSNLLRSVQLEDYAREPFVQTCKAIQARQSVGAGRGQP